LSKQRPALLTVQTPLVESTICVAGGIVVPLAERASASACASIDMVKLKRRRVKANAAFLIPRWTRKNAVIAFSKVVPASG
jgi:hypothetical protein